MGNDRTNDIRAHRLAAGDAEPRTLAELFTAEPELERQVLSTPEWPFRPLEPAELGAPVGPKPRHLRVVPEPSPEEVAESRLLELTVEFLGYCSVSADRFLHPHRCNDEAERLFAAWGQRIFAAVQQLPDAPVGRLFKLADSLAPSPPLDAFRHVLREMSR